MIHGKETFRKERSEGDRTESVLAWDDGGVGAEWVDASGILPTEGIERVGLWLVAMAVQEGVGAEANV